MVASASEVLQALNQGALDSQTHVSGLLAAIEQQEPTVQAWAHLNADHALHQARQADLRRSAGDTAPLLGVAVGLKDIIDTADFPTENGTVLHAGRRPSRDAALVARLREAGAVILGKTVTTELATYASGKTRNPHAPGHTPGGSSSGSAAALACGMVPLAIGSQTNGSTIRPGAYCGVVSFKPTRATIDRTGVLVQSPSFDTVGLFARDVADVSLLWSVLSATGADHAVAAGAPLARFFWMPGPLRELMEPGVEVILRQQALAWGASLGPPDMPVGTLGIIELHRRIMEAEIARCFEREYSVGAHQLSSSLQGQIERGRGTSDTELVSLQRRLSAAQAEVDGWMQQQGIDAWMTASAPGPAPAGLESTGNPVFCTLATALDLPALQLPGLRASNGLPIGMQLVARRSCDAGLLALGARLLGQLHPPLQGPPCTS